MMRKLKKLFLISFLILALPLQIWAATRTISVAGGNWNATTAWDEAAVPVAGDAVVARGGGDSGNVTINVASACASIILTNYTHTLTFTNTLTVTSTVTFPAGMTIAGTADLITVTGATLTIVPTLTGGLRLGGTSQTYALGATLTLNGTLLFNGTTATTFTGAYNITCGAISVTSAIMSITLSGTLTASGDMALSSATSSGFAGGFAVQAATCTITGGQTVTISAGVTITGILTNGTDNILNGAFNWTVGGLVMTADITSGTSAIVMTGGTWSGAGVVGIDLSLNSGVIVSGSVYFGSATSKTLTCQSSITTTGSTLNIALSCALNTGLMTWNNIIFTGTSKSYALSSALNLGGTLTMSHTTAIAFTGDFAINTVTWTITTAGTITIPHLITATGTLTLPNAAVTFAGTAGWTVATVAQTTITAARTHTFADSVAYTVTTAMNWSGTATYALSLFAGSTAKTIITLQAGATQDVGYVNPKWIDSSNGQRIFSYKGTITTCLNWTSTYTPVSGPLIGPGRLVR